MKKMEVEVVKNPSGTEVVLSKLFTSAIFLVLTACTFHRKSFYMAKSLSDGIILAGTPQIVFLNLWGSPDKTNAITSDTISGSRSGFLWGAFGRESGNQILQLWTYDSRKTQLVFDRRGRLVSWKTEATVKELAKPKEEQTIEP